MPKRGTSALPHLLNLMTLIVKAMFMSLPSPLSLSRWPTFPSSSHPSILKFTQLHYFELFYEAKIDSTNHKKKPFAGIPTINTVGKSHLIAAVWAALTFKWSLTTALVARNLARRLTSGYEELWAASWTCESSPRTKLHGASVQIAFSIWSLELRTSRLDVRSVGISIH